MTHPWGDMVEAMALLRHAPALNGMVLRIRPGPVWHGVHDALIQTFPDLRRWPASFSISDLSGGLDSTATLATGKVIYAKGLLEREHPILIPSAERMDTQAAALIAQAMDAGTAPLVILIDESADSEERVPEALADRLAFHCDLSDLSMRDMQAEPSAHDDTTEVSDPAALLVQVALQFGIIGMRAPMQALTAARAMSDTPNAGHLARAAALVLAPRALTFPEPQDEQSPDQPDPADQPGDNDSSNSTPDTLPEDLVVAAIQAVLPENLLEQTKPPHTKSGKGFSGSGSKRRGNRRGRPLPAQAGHLDGQARLDLVATLRAAVPWQTLRRREQPDRKGVILATRDIHVQRMEQRSDRVLVFTVDASGSSAMARLGEVKGAVELVLARAYARRDHVALVAFRRDGAEVLLPPTRSLVQAKRRLAGLPGGGGTPLAAGLEEGMRQALSARSRGLTPQMIVLTDGRGNIAIDGSANRAQASEDASRIARIVAASEIETLVIDTGARPQPQLAGLARDMQAQYVPLPRAQANQISDAISGVR